MTKLLEREIGPEAKEAIVTAGQQLIEQGRQEGRQQGRQEGRQEGRQQGIREVLLRQLRQRFGHEVDARVEQRIAAAAAEKLETWSERVLSAVTLAELLAD